MSHMRHIHKELFDKYEGALIDESGSKKRRDRMTSLSHVPFGTYKLIIDTQPITIVRLALK